MGLGFTRCGFAAMGLGFARCGCFFFFRWWVLLTVMLFSGGGVGNGLWSRFVFIMVAGYVVWVGFKFDGHGVGQSVVHSCGEVWVTMVAVEV